MLAIVVAQIVPIASRVKNAWCPVTITFGNDRARQFLKEQVGLLLVDVDAQRAQPTGLERRDHSVLR
jgi:hypothetical protein